MTGSAANITEFIDAKSYPPEGVIVPDATNADKMKHYARFFRAEINFRTLDGQSYICKTDNYNASSYFRIWANDTYILIEKPNNRGLFTFDARIRLFNNEKLDYSYISYPLDGWEDESMNTSTIFSLDRYPSAAAVNTKIAGKYPIFHVFSLNEKLSNALESAGFSTDFSANQALFDATVVSLNVRSVEWKFRSRVDKETYFTASYNVKYNDDVRYCASDDKDLYQNAVSTSDDLYDLDTWVDDVFPGW